jgi:tetratricopeptide (TPR) repeat protein
VTQNYLAFAYQDRVRGGRPENMERAIDYFHQALKVFTPQAHPEQWATTQNSLAIAYVNRQKGDRSGNYDEAIRHCQQQLDVFTREAHPERWAMAQFFLGTIMIDRKLGTKAEYTEQAIHYYQQALGVFTQAQYPEEWARVQAGLALVYKERGSDDRETEAGPVNPSPGLRYPDLYDEISGRHAEPKRHLKLIYADVPEIKFATNLLAVYQWEGELSEEEADRLRLRAAVFLSCAIYDAALAAGLACAFSPVLNGQRPTWMLEGESSPVSVTLSDTGMSDRTLQMSIGPVVVSVGNLPVNKVPLRKLMEGFQKQFNDIYV